MLRGLVAALLVHVALLLFFRTTRVAPPSPFGAAGPDAGDSRAAAGGGGMQAVEVRVRPAISAAAEVVPEPVIETPPEPEPLPVPDAPVETLEVKSAPAPVPRAGPELAGRAVGTGTAGQGGGRGEAVGEGRANGTGQGGGGAEEAGTSGMVAPVPRGMILPPTDRPSGARGKEITVWVFVSERGRVVADSTRLEPPTGNSGYDKRLRRSAAEWSFEPARSAGQPVAAWFPYQIIL